MTRHGIDVPEEKLAEFCRRNHIRVLSLFGSILRDDFRPDSDVDVLAEFDPGHTPGLALIRMEDELSALLGGRKVDLVLRDALLPRLRQRILEQAEVQFAREGVAALGLYKQQKEAGVPFDLVILDLSVPEGMGGKETIGQLKAYDPSVKAVISSGYSNDPVVQAFESYGFSGKLSKPYKISDMKNILELLIAK